MAKGTDGLSRSDLPVPLTQHDSSDIYWIIKPEPDHVKERIRSLGSGVYLRKTQVSVCCMLLEISDQRV